jgi:hypothetical protein
VPSRTLSYLYVAIAAIAAAGIVVGLTLDTRTTPRQPTGIAGKPPVPTGLAGPAGTEIETAFRDWPHGSIDTMQRLGLEYSRSAIVQFYRGIALLWAGYPSDAQTALESAKKLGRNTPIQGRADNILHPAFYQPTSGPSYPVFTPTSGDPLLRKGSLLQAEGHQISAERVFTQAVRKSPGNVEALVAQAVGMFDEDNLTPSFSHLGPLTKRFPKSQVVHYYLGLLLAWTVQREPAISQFEQAFQLGPNTELGKSAKNFLNGLATASASASAG